MCPFCLNQVESSVVLTNDCGHDHSCCRKCMRDYIRSLWHNPSEYPIRCFGFNCHNPLSIDNVIKKALNKNQFKHFTALSKKNKSEKSKKQRHRREGEREGEGIEGVSADAEEEKNDQLFRDLTKKNGWKQCPACKLFIDKIGNGNHVVHENCPYASNKNGKVHMCYRCGKIRKDCRCFGHNGYQCEMPDHCLGYVCSVIVALCLLYLVIRCLFPLINSTR